MDGNLSKVKLCSTSVKQVRTKFHADPGNFGSFKAKVSGKSPEDFQGRLVNYYYSILANLFFGRCCNTTS